MEYLPPVDTTGLLERVRVAIYLSLDELWSVPSDNALIATFLDPRFKHFNWTVSGKRDMVYQLVKSLYDTLKVNLCILDNIEDKSREDDDGDDFFRELEGDRDIQTNTNNDDKVSRYAKLGNIKVKVNYRDSFPVLTQLARKYLSILATSVLSERLFSDAGNHISAKRTRLAPDLVNKFLFLKRNSVHFKMFSLQEI